MTYKFTKFYAVIIMLHKHDYVVAEVNPSLKNVVKLKKAYDLIHPEYV